MMKKLLSFLFSLTVTLCFGQYQPIISPDSTSWALKHEVWDGAQIVDLYLEDTVSIDSFVYHKVNLEYQMIGYFREDTTSGKAWFLGVDDTIEYLVMDLSLAEGDFFMLKFPWPDTFMSVEVLAVDTIRGRKTLTLDYHLGGGFISEDLTFIEGVGPSASIFYPYRNVSIGYLFGFLVCKMFQNEVTIYAWDTLSGGCGIMIGIENEYQAQDHGVKLYPNPTHSKVHFEFLDKQLLGETIIIYDHLGRVLIRRKVDYQTVEIDLSHYSSSMFVYVISRSSGQIRGKILKP